MVRRLQKGVVGMADGFRPVHVTLIGTREWRYCHG